ncbi:acetaldehyde dehydrogenase (acetylating) [Neomoorella humiferrea]|uniref:acetaldehyde dehydrogenase (acetylating) n=1 Tax=Neomoorella humiferrea TaxID=676965 RepID=UPI003BB0E363
MLLDYDLSSIQEARDLVRKAKEAQSKFAEFTPEQIDGILVAMVKAIEENAEWLARMAVDETKYGVFEHKVIKNLFASREVYNSIKNIKTIGVINEDKERKVLEVAVPAGVILGITPTTNPTSTIIHNAICAIKGANAIIFSPHPNAVKCSNATAQVLHEAAVKAGAPEGIIGCISKITMKATEELMHHEDVNVIVATGGSAMVRAAYSAGKPAFGVGPGNVPVFIERTADIKRAVEDIIISKTFDNGMICASEQAIIVDEPVREQVKRELCEQGCYILSTEETEKISRVVMNPNGAMNPAVIGKSPEFIAARAGIRIPEKTRLLIAPLDGYGPQFPLSYEKLTTVLAFYTVKNWEEGCKLSIELLKLGGIGHTFAIHSRDDRIIKEFIRKPTFRIVVNTPSALGAIGYTTGLLPSLTLGCGTWGGSSISENLGPHHLINIKRLAYGIRRPSIETPEHSVAQCQFTADDIASIVKQVLNKLQVHRAS